MIGGIISFLCVLVSIWLIVLMLLNNFSLLDCWSTMSSSNCIPHWLKRIRPCQLIQINILKSRWMSIWLSQTHLASCWLLKFSPRLTTWTITSCKSKWHGPTSIRMVRLLKPGKRTQKRMVEFSTLSISRMTKSPRLKSRSSSTMDSDATSRE